MGRAKVKTTNDYIEGAKRQYVPAVIEWICPECGAECVEDLSGSGKHLSHPKLSNGDELSDQEVYLYCEKCGYEGHVRGAARLSFELTRDQIIEVGS